MGREGSLLLEGEVHLVADDLALGVEAFEDLGEDVDGGVAAQPCPLRLEFFQQILGGHRLAGQVPPHRLLRQLHLPAEGAQGAVSEVADPPPPKKKNPNPLWGFPAPPLLTRCWGSICRSGAGGWICQRVAAAPSPVLAVWRLVGPAPPGAADGLGGAHTQRDGRRVKDRPCGGFGAAPRVLRAVCPPGAGNCPTGSGSAPGTLRAALGC